ncbi:MAG: AAA family ATPase [Pyrinomonadaceae bacterium]
MQIIANKIALPERVSQLSRPRLLKLLEEGLESRAATVMCGRAGTGKSLLAAEFARQCRRHIAWFKVDGADDQPAVFFHYLLESIRAHRPRFCEKWEKTFRLSENENDLRLFAEYFAGELQEHQGEPMLIVLDDLHQVYDADWVAPFFSRLVSLLPRDVHLLICGRSLPPGPLWRLRSKQVLAVVDESVLAFTEDETRQLLKGDEAGQSVAEVMKDSRGRAARVDEFAGRSRRFAGLPFTQKTWLT